jgi:hypothetical protein
MPLVACARLWLVAALLIVSGSGCTGREALDDSGVSMYRGVPELTVRVTSTSDPSAVFSAISGLDVDSRGNVYVGDIFQQRVTVLDPNGSVVRTFGRRGSGPGEFQAIRGVQVLAGDSVLVYDPALARVSVFTAAGAELAYVVNLAAAAGGAAWFHVSRTRGSDRYLALFRAPFSSGRQSDSPRTEVVHFLDSEGTPIGSPLLTQPTRSLLVAGRSITPNPFGGQGLLAMNAADVVHRLWSHDSSIERYTPGGERLTALRFAHEPLPVSSSDIEAELEQFDGRARGVFEQVLRDSVPSHWPAVHAMVIDDADRIWLGLAGPRHRAAAWVVLGADGTPTGRARLPPGSTVWRIRGDRLYFERADDTDAPRIHVAEVR